VDVALVETTSGDQLVCPRFDCESHLKLVDGAWVDPTRREARRK
jgi:hypothetical protein